jgi:hypothetical protein
MTRSGKASLEPVHVIEFPVSHEQHDPKTGHSGPKENPSGPLLPEQPGHSGETSKFQNIAPVGKSGSSDNAVTHVPLLKFLTYCAPSTTKKKEGK